MNNPREILRLTNWAAEDPRAGLLSLYIARVRDAGITLVSRADRERLLERHVLPSLEALPHIPETGMLLDIGSGGGFPAIPLALARPRLKVLLVEASARKAAFLRRVSRETELKELDIQCTRIEDLGSDHNGIYTIITARAVADLPELLGWSTRLLAPGGRYLLWKGRNWRSEGELDGLGVVLEREQPLSDGGRLIMLRMKAEG